MNWCFLLDQLEASDKRQLLRLSVCRVDNTDNHEGKAYNADCAADDPADKGNQTKDAARCAQHNLRKEQNQSLIGVETRESGIRRRQKRDEEQDADVREDSHDLVVRDVLAVKLCCGVGSVVELRESRLPALCLLLLLP